MRVLPLIYFAFIGTLLVIGGILLHVYVEVPIAIIMTIVASFLWARK